MKIQNKTLLITGGTGSFGNAVLKRFLNTDYFKEIRIFRRDEKKQDVIRNQFKSEKFKFYIGDVRDFHSVESAMHGVDYVFYAAALTRCLHASFFHWKHEDQCSRYSNAIYAAIANKVAKVICLITDKAANPKNAMGISKAMMEKVAIANFKRIYLKIRNHHLPHTVWKCDGVEGIRNTTIS